MKKIIILIASLLLVITLSACDDTTYIEEIETNTLLELNTEDLEDDLYEYTSLWGNEAALSADSLTLEEMLIYGIEDEYSAYTEYEYILENFEVTTPFSNIINAEANHVSMLLPLFDAYEITVPEDDSENHLIFIEDLEDTFRTGVIAEILNIDMYNVFLEYDLPDDVRDVFISLRDASIKHLAAFQRNVDKYE